MAAPKQSVFAGQRYGQLVVVKEHGRTSGKQRTYLCKCDCGKETVVAGSELRQGKTHSCGCWRASLTWKRHGHTAKGWSSPTYRSWANMVYRCTNQKCRDWQNYGARGITVCDRWRDSFEAFLADMGERPEGRTIDRIDNDGPYSPTNCRWADAKTQRRNQRKCKPVIAGYGPDLEASP